MNDSNEISSLATKMTVAFSGLFRAMLSNTSLNALGQCYY